MDKELIIGILTGSLGTIFIKELINQLNKKIDFDRDLTKYVYQKKIEAAEKAMAFYSTYLNLIVEIRESFRVIKKSIEDEAQVDFELLQQLIDINSNHLKTLFEKSYSEINAVNLYFDLSDEEDWNESDIQEMYSNLAEVKMRDTEILTLSNLLTQHEKNGEDELVEHYADRIEGTLSEYLASLEKLINSYSRNKTAIDSTILKLKKQIKKKTGL